MLTTFTEIRLAVYDEVIIRRTFATFKAVKHSQNDFTQKGEKRGMTNTKMYTFLEQNIVEKAFLWLHKLTQKLTFGIIYFLKI